MSDTAQSCSLAGVLIHTSRDRFDAMRRFYVDALGLSPRSDRSGFVNFELGDQRLTITLHSEVAGPALDRYRLMINLSTDDLDAAHARLLEHGAPELRPPSPEAWGGRISTVLDPDGNTIQLMELPDR